MIEVTRAAESESEQESESVGVGCFARSRSRNRQNLPTPADSGEAILFPIQRNRNADLIKSFSAQIMWWTGWMIGRYRTADMAIGLLVGIGTYHNQ